MDFVANSMQRALGYTLFGSDTDNSLTGKTLYTHSILVGQDVLVKQIGTSLFFYDDTDNAWYLLTDATFTTGLRWSFATFNGYLYGDDGVDNWIFWHGSARSTLNGDILAGATSITLATGQGARFDASGDVMIENDKITYGSIVGDVLTTCSGVSSNHSSGKTVVQKLDSTTYSGLTKARQIAFFRNRLYAVDYATPNFLRHSKLADNTNPETDIINFTVAGSGTGDAGFGIAPDEIVSIKPIITGNQTSVLAVLCKDGVVYAFVVTDGASTTTNTFIPMRTMNSYPAAPHLVCVAENDLVFIDQHGSFRTLSQGDVNTAVQVTLLSDAIKPSLDAMDFSDGAIKYHNRKLYGTGMSPDASSNDLTFYRDATYGSWGAYSHWDVIDYAIYNDELMALSAVTGEVWKLNDGYNANDLTYYSEMVTRDQDFGLALQYKSGLKVRMAGFITSNCPAYIDFFFDNSASPLTYLISGDSTDIVGNEPNVAVGSVVFGSGVMGGGLPGGVVRRDFIAELLFNDIQTFFKFSMRIRIDSQDVDFELTDAVVYAREESEELWLPAQTLAVN